MPEPTPIRPAGTDPPPALPGVRLAEPRDAEALARLSGQLGYQATPAEIGARLAQLSPGGDREVFVVERDGGVVAWMELDHRRALESGEWAEICGLVVDSALRGGGIGAGLVRFAEEWARRRGLTRLRVRTNEKRTRTHAFYEREGFAWVKAQRVYDKPVAR